MYQIYNEHNVSNFVFCEFASENESVNTIMNSLRNYLINNQNNEVITPIITESDFKLMLYNSLMAAVDNANNMHIPPIEVQVHTELADKKIQSDICDGFGQTGDKLVRSDITMTIDPILIQGSHGINKSFTLNGIHVDFELKYIRNQFKTEKLKEIKKDLCKLKCLVYGESAIEIHLHGHTVMGIAILLFENEEILSRYINHNEVISLIQEINQIQELDNLFTLFMYKTH